MTKYTWKLGFSAVAFLLAAACARSGDSSDDALDSVTQLPEPAEIEEAPALPAGTPDIADATDPMTGEPLTDEDCDVSSDEVADPSGAQAIAFRRKQCWATCTVTDLDPNDGACPVTLGGYASGEWFRRCSKVCEWAEGDAASKLPSGCIIQNCSFAGC